MSRAAFAGSMASGGNGGLPGNGTSGGNVNKCLLVISTQMDGNINTCLLVISTHLDGNINRFGWQYQHIFSGNINRFGW